MSDLIEWFEEADGFSQGTKAPHKWVLQAEQELRIQTAALSEAQATIARLRDALLPCAAILAAQNLPEGRECLIGGAFRVTVGEALDKVNAALSSPHATRGEAG